jgi:hypothetical protein
MERNPKVICLSSAYIPHVGALMAPVDVNGQRVVMTICNDRVSNEVIGRNLRKKSFFGTVSLDPDEDSYVEHIASDSATKKGKYAVCTLVIGNVILYDTRIFVVDKVLGSAEDDCIPRRSLDKYKHVLAITSPVHRSFMEWLIDRRVILHASMFADMSSVYSPSGEARHVPIMLGIRDDDTPIQSTIRIFNRFNVPTNLHTTVDPIPVVFIQEIRITSPSGECVRVCNQLWASINIGVPTMSFPTAVYESLVDAIRHGSSEEEWTDSDIWEDGQQEWEQANTLLSIPISRCPTIEIFFRSYGEQPIMIRLDRNKYLYRMPTYTVTHASEGLPYRGKTTIDEVRFGIEESPSRDVHCTLGNLLLLERSFLLDWNRNSLTVYR